MFNREGLELLVQWLSEVAAERYLAELRKQQEVSDADESLDSPTDPSVSARPAR